MSSISCHCENDTVVVTLPTTALCLTEDEALSLHKRVFMELLRGLLDDSDGKVIDETIHIASAPISRSQAWEVTKSMERMWSPDEDTDELNVSAALPALTCDEVNWRSEGF